MLLGSLLRRKFEPSALDLASYHFFTGAFMEAFSRDRGPCVALASRECQANPNRDSVYTRVPAEYRVEHELDASAVVCRSNMCHAKVGLRGPPRQAGRPVGWRKHTEVRQLKYSTLPRNRNWVLTAIYPVSKPPMTSPKSIYLSQFLKVTETVPISVDIRISVAQTGEK